MGEAKELQDAANSQQGTHVVARNKRGPEEVFFFAFLTNLLSVSAIVGIIVGVKSSKISGTDIDNIRFTPSHYLVKTACSSALYRELCFSAITSEPGFTENLSSHKDARELSLNITISSLSTKFEPKKGLTKGQKVALHDCLETVGETLYELRHVIVDLKDSTNHADDIKTFLSVAMTNQETCLNGFSFNKDDRSVRERLKNGQVHMERLCSNALAMIKDMTDNDMSSNNRKLMELEEVDGGTWPVWMSIKDSSLLQSSMVTPNVVVAAYGSRDHRTVSEATVAAPTRSSTRQLRSLEDTSAPAEGCPLMEIEKKKLIEDYYSTMVDVVMDEKMLGETRNDKATAMDHDEGEGRENQHESETKQTSHKDSLLGYDGVANGGEIVEDDLILDDEET
ncbi:pectinesterase 3-like [Prosopis cineraria]|uniref:pectinesterase 3-like n=1 Tax=Prosopis cineraria TaxID=364024 RepID=UPI0024108765|nr:pectinesterase 3-like [Prosopis cineraria]